MIALILAAALDPQSLFAAAREARSQSAYAHYAVYATVATFRLGDHHVTRTWDTVEDVRRRIVFAHAISREEHATPHVPHGINIGAGGVGHSGYLQPGEMPPKGRTMNPERDVDAIGQLSFAVDQDFGLALNAPAISTTKDMSDVSAGAPTLPRIGRTGTIARTYDVTDLGDVNDAGVTLHHLALRPLGDPHRFRLRELWLDPATSLPARAVVAGIGNRAPLDAVDWRIEFRQIEGGTYLAKETALAPLQTDQGTVEDASIAFTELRPANRLTPLESLGLASDVGTTDP